MLRSMMLAAAALTFSLLAPVAAPSIVLAAAPQDAQSAKPDEKNLTPEQKMARRHPQPVRVGDLIGLPMLDQNDSMLGTIREVVRTPAGRIFLVIDYRAWLAWGPTGWGRKIVAVPLETVAILGRQVAALDFSREEFTAAPIFAADQSTRLAPNDMITIAITRR